jgi:hypothetical protein
VRAAFLFLSIRYFISRNLVSVRPLSPKSLVLGASGAPISSELSEHLVGVAVEIPWTSKLWNIEPQICGAVNLKFVE